MGCAIPSGRPHGGQAQPRGHRAAPPARLVRRVVPLPERLQKQALQRVLARAGPEIDGRRRLVAQREAVEPALERAIDGAQVGRLRLAREDEAADVVFGARGQRGKVAVRRKAQDLVAAARQRAEPQPAGLPLQLPHIRALFARLVEAAPHGLVHGRHDEVLEHLHVLEIDGLGADRQAHQLVLAVHGRLDNAAARGGLVLLRLHLLLHLQQVLLHLLGLLHHLRLILSAHGRINTLNGIIQ